MSTASATLLHQATAFALCPMAGFSFALDSHVVRGIDTKAPQDGRCLDLADVLALPRPQGDRRTLHLFDPECERFFITVGAAVRVRDIALSHVQRIPTFLAQVGALRYAFAIIDVDHHLSYLLDTTALARRHREEFG